MDNRKVGDLVHQFDENRRGLSGYFRSRGFSPEDSEDLAQETFVRALKGLDGFRHEAKLKTWLFHIARNVLRQEIRRRRTVKRDIRESSVADPDDMQGRLLDSRTAAQLTRDEGSQPLSQLLDSERMQLVSEALADLPPKMRNCILLYAHQERKYREIAVLAQISINTVKSQIHEARQLLKARLGDLFDCYGR